MSDIPKLKFLTSNKSKLMFISEDADLFEQLESKSIYYVLVDELNILEFCVLDVIFEKADVVVFVNNIQEKIDFNSGLTEILLTYFNTVEKINDSVIYLEHDFIDKRDLPRTSDYNDLNTIDVGSKKMRYIGQTGTSGYASAAKGYIARYVLNNDDIQWVPLKFDNSANDRTNVVDILAESALKNKITHADTTFLHSTPDLWSKFIRKYKSVTDDLVGYCTWETSRLPVKWVDSINEVEHVYVPSTFNKEAFIDSGVNSEITVVPHVKHTEILPDKSNVDLVDYFGRKIPRKYTFYGIGELNHRKGIEDLVTVFDRMYETNTDIQLVLKLHYQEYTQKNVYHCIKEIKKITKNLNVSIYLILGNLNRRQLLALHSVGDCYVSLNKGEGFGLTVFDAFNFGKRIVTTNYGGTLEYLKEGSHMVDLVDCKIDSVHGMGSFSDNYTSDQQWAYPDLDDAYDKMRNCI